MAGTPGIDVSRWQGEIDWRLVAAAGYRFAVIRATVSSTYTDPRFYTNWDGAREAGLLVSAYHAVRPSAPADAQIGRLFDTLEARVPDLPLVLDVELADGMSAAEISEAVRECARLVEERAGRKPIMYTGGWFWNPNIVRSPDWADYDLWIAHYGVDEPTLPKDWTAWRFWQYSETGSVPGVSSRNTDLDWFNGTYEELLAYAQASEEEHEGEEEEKEIIQPERLRARVVTESLRMRSGPGVQYSYLGDLPQGTVIDIQAIEGKEVWVSFEPGKWVAMVFQGERYLKLE